MAIQKPIEQQDGIIASYHRIAFIQNVINQHNSIIVFSYFNEEARNKEKNKTSDNIYKQSITYEIDYVEDLTAEQAYQWLKEQPQYEGAIDV